MAVEVAYVRKLETENQRLREHLRRIKAKRPLIGHSRPAKSAKPRSETCIADILTILTDAGADSEQVEKITARLAQHYSPVAINSSRPQEKI